MKNDIRTEKVIIFVLSVLFAITLITGVFQIKQLNVLSEQTKVKLSELNNELEKTQTEASAAQEQFQLNNSKYLLLIKKLNQKSTDASEQLSDKTDTINSLTEENSTLQQQILILKNEIIKLQSEIEKQASMKSYSTVKYTSEEREMLYCLVQNECGSSEIEHKRIIANIVLNRVKSNRFPNTISEVIAQEGQFAKITAWQTENKNYDEDTVKAVDEVLTDSAIDESHGALYFYSTNYLSDHNAIQWFEHKSFLFEAYGHRFFK
ncbi:MAG: hypothetical protein A2Y17_07965 [Clostridiales bacterium GWF2_38_85]|nr:MAG: hypothetical protein A2Y17_07965 [Clostridiales bacterium GWF2_38_85]HBL84188.1 hypothetical protein [Clostridiales bacterium]